MENTPTGHGIRKYVIGGMVAVLALGAIGITGAVQANGFRGHGFGPFGGFGLERALRSVEVTDGQRDGIWAIIDGARSDIRPMLRGMEVRREALEGLLTAEVIDRAAVETLRLETLASADAVSARATEALLDAAELLTQQQRAGLVELRGSFRPGFGPGRN
ncbi:Spy/CpxP family protein refolding chaperone [Pseudogemmobacter sonorensis]|uniref:Spy/CpxP family protein refolding chaperone n=1 Tax=Pseudogemmobacter sonorensis TaxID=2989681 RepID=UPI00368D9B48